jgi:hypothetical protein
VNASAVIARSLISEIALKRDADNQQQFCFSRDFDSKICIRVCQVASGFSFLDDFREFPGFRNPLALKSHLDST